MYIYGTAFRYALFLYMKRERERVVAVIVNTLNYDNRINNKDYLVYSIEVASIGLHSQFNANIMMMMMMMI
jgi:hypothetical protein